MEGKTKVKVKFGRTFYSADGDPTEFAILFAKDEAIDRLVTRFPKVENIETETRISYSCDPNIKGKMGCKASAFGYVPKGKNSTRHIIKDITSTKLYQCITEKIDKDHISVVAYVLRYVKKSNANHYVEFSGKGGIPWEQLKDAINVHNQVELDTGLRKKDLLLINPNELYIDFKLAKGRWDGNIILSDGSWIEISLSFSKVEQEYYNTIERHCPPKLDIPDSRFEVTTVKEERY